MSPTSQHEIQFMVLWGQAIREAERKDPGNKWGTRMGRTCRTDSKGYSSPKERLALSRRKAQARRVGQAKLRPQARQIGGMQWGVGGGASQAGAGSAEMEAEVRTAPWTTDQQGQGATGTLLPTEEFVSTGVEKEGRRAWRGHLEPCDKGLYSRLESRDLGSPRSLGAVLDIMNCPGAGHSNALVCNPETIFRPTFTGS